ncbi:hypothetical protein B0T19DRAFT_429538 [Cercophora scortea]|uniref:Uncharacterized protein n=1 Tax=Cercophora scortea TaxID=314031 RepID=A0AAE0I9Y4_9PEZI|nr:hypothetical protein B0T19DRAFT_429538 [Cercophora scortea]
MKPESAIGMGGMGVEQKSRTAAKWKAVAVAALSFAVSAVLIFITTVENKLKPYGVLSSSEKILYTTGTTIIATILTMIITGEIVELFLFRFDDRFVPHILAAGQATSSPSTSDLVSSWRAVLGLGPNSFTNKLRPRNWHITLVLALSALITTCITAGFTPTTLTTTVNYTFAIPSGDTTVFARSYLPSSQMPDSPASYNHSSWILPNGSIFYSWSGRGGSPAHEAMGLATGINIVDPSSYAYADEGVAVHPSAIGTPFSIYASNLQQPNNLSHLLQAYDFNIREVSACVPVMVRNPFKCRKGAVMGWLDNDRVFRITSDDGTCVLNKTVANANQTEMLKWWCTRDEVGQATVLIGANFNYHAWVAVAVNDDTIPPYNVPERYTYSVQCDVDTRDVFEYRKVVLRLGSSAGRDITTTTGPGFSRTLAAQGPCVPDYDGKVVVSDTLRATAATANHYLLTENSGSSGWFEMINRLTTRSGGYGLSAGDSKRAPPWAFADSSNALEDVLGLAAALVSSRIIKNSTAVQTVGVATVDFTRLGTGNRAALLFAIPPLVSGLVLLFLAGRIRKQTSGYESCNPLDLVDLGRASMGAGRWGGSMASSPTPFRHNYM